MARHIPPMPPLPSLDDLRREAPDVTADDLVHVATVAAMHLSLAGWERLDDGKWIGDAVREPVTFAVAVDLHMRRVADRIDRAK